MKYRSTLVYLAVAAALVGLYVYDTRREQAKESLSREAARLFHSRADEIDGVLISRASGEIRMEKAEGGGQQRWQITAPLRTDADGMAAAALTGEIAGLHYKSIVSEDGDWSPFGLDQPELIVSFRAGEKEDTISFGAPNPLGDAVYAKKGQLRTIYLIDASEKRNLDKSLYDLRSKRLFTLDPEEVDRVAVTSAAGKWSMCRKEGEWLLDGEGSFKAETEKVESLIRATITAYPNSFVEEKAADLSPYGLTLPKARVALSDGRRTEEILFGDPMKQENGLIYAAMGGKPQVVSVRKRLLEDLPKSRDEFRPVDPEIQKGGDSR